MTLSMTQRWAAVTAVVMAAVLAAGWFLLISPKRAEAADINAQATQQRATNDGLRQQLVLLKAQSLDLPRQKAKLAVLRTQIPDNPALPALVRSLTASARQVGVKIESLSPAPPALVAATAVTTPVAPSTATTATDASGGTDSTATAGTSPAVPAAPVAPAAAPLYEVVLNLDVTGSYFELEQFVNKLEGHKRSFLVTGFSLNKGSGTGASSSDSAGDLTLSVQGKVFMSPTIAQVATTPITASAGSAAPAN